MHFSYYLEQPKYITISALIIGIFLFFSKKIIWHLKKIKNPTFVVPPRGVDLPSSSRVVVELDVLGHLG